MSDRRNVIMVTVDSIRADHCHFMGYGEETTPTLDRFVEEGLVFTDAVAPGPATAGSVPVVLTGEFPVEPETGESLGATAESRIRRHMRTRETLAERFSRLGYTTGAFITNPWTSRHFGVDSGFDDFEDFIDAGDGATESTDRRDGDLRGDSLFSRVRGHLRDWRSNRDVFMPWEAYFDDVVEWIRTAERPYFLWLFLIDVHMPYHSPPAYRSRSSVTTGAAHLWLLSGMTPAYGSLFRGTLVDAYDDSIRYTDEFLRRLEAEVGTDPLILVHGDHGEEFGEHGAYGHGSNLCEEVLHVPLVVANGPTGRVDAPVSLRSIPRLLTGLAVGEEPDVTAPYVFAGNRNNLAVRGGSWKYVSHADGTELYRLADGSEERTANERLETIGRRLVEQWREDRAEKLRIRSGSETVGGTTEL